MKCNLKILSIILSTILMTSTFALAYGASNADRTEFLKAFDPDAKKDPSNFVYRYEHDVKYKTWFDKNFGSQYKSIYEAVGLPEPKDNSEPKSTYVQLYKDTDYGFAFDLFKKWNIEESQESLVTLYYNGKNTGAIMPMITLQYAQTEAGLSSSMNCDAWTSQLFSSYGVNQKMIKCTSEPINGGSKTIIKILEKSSFEGKYFKQKRNTVFYYKDTGDVYTMIFQSDVKDYQQVIKDFDNLQKSFMTFPVSNE